MRRTIGQTDPNGVKSVSAFITKDGQGYCITEAPNADAVCRAHEAKGLKVPRGDVHEVATRL